MGQADALRLGKLREAVWVRVICQVGKFHLARQSVSAQLTVILSRRLLWLPCEQLNYVDYRRWHMLLEQLCRSSEGVLEDVMQQRRGDCVRIRSIDVTGHPTHVLDIGLSDLVDLPSVSISCELVG